jgi:hypothetical protein
MTDSQRELQKALASVASRRRLQWSDDDIEDVGHDLLNLGYTRRLSDLITTANATDSSAMARALHDGDLAPHAFGTGFIRPLDCKKFAFENCPNAGLHEAAAPSIVAALRANAGAAK